MPDPSGHMTEKEFAADVAAGKNEWEKTKPTTSTRGSGQSGSYVENGQVWMDVPELDEFGDPTGKMIPKRVDRAPGWGSGSGHSNDALVAAQAALSGFLQAQTLADARKSAAMDQFQKLSQWAVPDDAKYAPNFEPGGLANEAAAVAGMQKFMPPRLQTAKINAGSIQNPGQVPKEILDMIGAVRGAASQGKGVSDMAEQVQGDQQYPDTNYATGQAWYQMYPNLLNSINGGRAQRATTGLGTLGYLTNLITSPTSGPLGLAATASYGGPQGILAGTGGKGIDNSSQMSRYNTLLDNLLGYSNDMNKHASDIPTVDPNNAPGPTPENAAKAPTTADQWTAAFKAYHQGMTPEQWNNPAAKAQVLAWNAYHPGQPYQGAQEGGIIRAADGARIGQPIPNARPGVTPTPTPMPNATPGGDEDVPYMGPMPNAPNRGDVANGLGVLGDAAKHFVDLKMGTADQFWANVQKVGRFQHFIDSLESGPGETTQQRAEQQGRLDKIVGPSMGAPGAGLDLGSGAVSQDKIVEMLRAFSNPAAERGGPNSGQRRPGMPEFMAEGGRLPVYDNGGLQMLANVGLDSPEKVQQALAASRSQGSASGSAGGGDRRMAAINEFGQSPLARSAMQFASGGLEGTFGGAAGDNGLAHGGYQIRTDAHRDITPDQANDPWEATKYMSNDYNLAAERVQRENPGLADGDPAKANALVAFYAEHPTAMYSENRYRTLWDQMFPRKANGGGVTLAGQPHWIVDDSGKPVAEITEDGSPEHVRGMKNGGVEVTPLRPDRYKTYTGRTAGDPQWTQMLAGLQGEVNKMNEQTPNLHVPGAETGQQWLLPEIPNSMVNTPGGGGSNEIPTTGGPTSAIPTGRGFGADAHPKSIDDLMNMTKTPAGGNLIDQFTRMMGGALGSRYTNMGDQVASMNQGKVNPSLMSSQQMATMSPTERAQYTALLQQMGVIGSPEDLNDQIKKFTPDGL